MVDAVNDRHRLVNRHAAGEFAFAKLLEVTPRERPFLSFAYPELIDFAKFRYFFNLGQAEEMAECLVEGRAVPTLADAGLQLPINSSDSPVDVATRRPSMLFH